MGYIECVLETDSEPCLCINPDLGKTYYDAKCKSLTLCQITGGTSNLDKQGAARPTPSASFRTSAALP
jgi:hypothetical protein